MVASMQAGCLPLAASSQGSEWQLTEYGVQLTGFPGSQARSMLFPSSFHSATWYAALRSWLTKSYICRRSVLIWRFVMMEKWRQPPTTLHPSAISADSMVSSLQVGLCEVPAPTSHPQPWDCNMLAGSDGSRTRRGVMTRITPYRRTLMLFVTSAAGIPGLRFASTPPHSWLVFWPCSKASPVSACNGPALPNQRRHSHS
ncbi:hypothetical protein IF1G_01764 [Cordyceps javanica]|uniref:Uncharacterized protein n=1 Tax=Cordyceps javanica TaxID=43265 RepID=A0A545VD58_9HYPO|nr:hypothetical protein IF1G_01764 [Cordyceps javanica]